MYVGFSKMKNVKNIKDMRNVANFYFVSNFQSIIYRLE